MIIIVAEGGGGQMLMSYSFDNLVEREVERGGTEIYKARTQKTDNYVDEYGSEETDRVGDTRAQMHGKDSESGNLTK